MTTTAAVTPGSDIEPLDVIVIGAGQAGLAGLALAHPLQQHGLPFS